MNYKRNIPVALILIVLLSTSALSAQNSNTEYRLNKEFLKDLTHNFGVVFTSPLHWNSKDWLYAAGVLGTTAVVYAFDEDIREWAQEGRTESSDDVWKALSYLGKGGTLLVLSGGLYAAGELADSKSIRKTAILSLESYLISGVIVLGIKYVVGRARPYTEEGKSSFNPFSSGSSHYSMPSGHTTSAFSVASVIAYQSDSLALDIAAYSLATLVGISRLKLDKHWASDLVIGAALGTFVGHKICTLHDKKDNNKLNLSFSFSPSCPAITLSYSF